MAARSLNTRLTSVSQPSPHAELLDLEFPDEIAYVRLQEYRRLADPAYAGALTDAWRLALDALSATPTSDVRRLPRAIVVAQVFFVHFDYTGNFSVLDGAIEMTRRVDEMPGSMTVLPNIEMLEWQIENESWPGAILSRRALSDHWRIRHPSGAVARILGKNWKAWNGDGWPSGWTVYRADGDVQQFDEGHFGDDWRPLGSSRPAWPQIP